MATEVLVSVEEYLKTSYRPDRDYLDGELNAVGANSSTAGRSEKFSCFSRSIIRIFASG